MAHGSAAAARDIADYLEAQETKDLLRFITCGSVDDGKSTLIGRLLYDSKLIFEDQLAAVRADSRRFGTQGSEADLALLVDGLQAEREQGITIDVAYRFFSTDKRKFIVADTPGHEQYTRNMATGASTAELAVILVDARNGILTQTRRHSFIVSLMGIRHVVLAVNKMDLVGYDQARFDEIAGDYRALAEDIGITDLRCMPISALEGDNVFRPSEAMPWYGGPPLMELLETIEVRRDLVDRPFRFPVQWVNRPSSEFRGFSGTVASGTLSRGDEIVVAPSGARSRVARIVTPEGDLETALAGQAVTLVLAHEIDVSRGDIIARPEEAPETADQFAVHLIWMHDEPMLPERTYLMRIGTRTVTARVTDLRHRIDVDSLQFLAAKTLGLNEVGYCNISLDQEIPFDPFTENRETGAFVLIDKLSNATVGAGMINFALWRAANVSWHEMKIGKPVRARQKRQRPCVLWFTGLPGAGKSTIADRLEQKLVARNRHTYLLDGDNVRHGLNKDLGFTDQDRVENIRRVAEVAKLIADAGLVVLVSFISPFRAERRMARDLMDEGEFIEIYVDTPLEVCEARDPKGLYKKARAGEIRNFTGIDSAYEVPYLADITLRSDQHGVDQLADQIIDHLEKGGYV